MPDPAQPLTSALIPPGTLPPLGERDLPPPVPLRQMIGPSIILAGLALGSGEFVLWPYITLQEPVHAVLGLPGSRSRCSIS